MTQLRVRVYLPQCYQHEPVMSKLIADYNLVVNITGAMLNEHLNEPGYYDIELKGKLLQITDGLNYLQSLHIQIKGKANVDSDSWCY